MTATDALADGDAAAGEAAGFALVSAREVHRGHAFSVDVETWRMPDGVERTRDIAHHTGAVAVVLLDAEGRILLIRQFRPAVRRHLLELPAGLLDAPGEAASAAAARELAEETDFAAATWHVLADAYTTPGMSDEGVRIFLARDITAIEAFDRTDEEADLSSHWLPLDDAVALVAAGQLANSLAVIGILAAARSRDHGWDGLRPLDAPWDARPGHQG